MKRRNQQWLPLWAERNRAAKGAWFASHLNINCSSCCIWSRQNFFPQISFWEAKYPFFLHQLWNWAWLHNIHSSQVSNTLHLPKRDLDHVQILFWISINSSTIFQCLWSHNVFNATHQHCKHSKDKGKHLAAPRPFFSILRDPSLQPLNIWKSCTRQLSSYSIERRLWEMAINIYFPYFISALCFVQSMCQNVHSTRDTVSSGSAYHLLSE